MSRQRPRHIFLSSSRRADSPIGGRASQLLSTVLGVVGLVCLIAVALSVVLVLTGTISLRTSP
jgi:hypothetical protein